MATAMTGLFGFAPLKEEAPPVTLVLSLPYLGDGLSYRCKGATHQRPRNHPVSRRWHRLLRLHWDRFAAAQISHWHPAAPYDHCVARRTMFVLSLPTNNLFHRCLMAAAIFIGSDGVEVKCLFYSSISFQAGLMVTFITVGSPGVVATRKVSRRSLLFSCLAVGTSASTHRPNRYPLPGFGLKESACPGRDSAAPSHCGYRPQDFFKRTVRSPTRPLGCTTISRQFANRRFRTE